VRETVTLFDALLYPASLRAGDLEDLRFFGVGGALACADAGTPSAPDVARAWAGLAGTVLRRMRRAGVAGYAAVGVHPLRIPRRGLEALLAELPEHLGRPRVVALGPVGVEEGGRREEEVFARQLALAAELRRPVVVHTPSRDKERLTRRALAVLREAEVDPSRVLVAGADARTVRMIRACGHVAGLSLAEGRREAPLDEAVRLVRALGSDGLALASSAGDGAGDLLALPRAAARLAKAGLSPAVIRRVCGENVRRLLGVEP
jgi:predicted metal-dependent TIM-barrel fold hydrolase